MDKQREAFEKAYGELVIGAPFDLDDTGTAYIDVDTDTAWEVWQAALAQPAGEPVAKVVRNAAGQTTIQRPDGGSFDVSPFVGAEFYTHPAQPAVEPVGFTDAGNLDLLEKDVAAHIFPESVKDKLINPKPLYTAPAQDSKVPEGWWCPVEVIAAANKVELVLSASPGALTDLRRAVSRLQELLSTHGTAAAPEVDNAEGQQA